MVKTMFPSADLPERRLNRGQGRPSQVYLLPAARTEKLLFIDAVKVVHRWVEESCSRGRVAVVGAVAHPLDAGEWEVGANGRDPVGAAVCRERGKTRT